MLKLSMLKKLSDNPYFIYNRNSILELIDQTKPCLEIGAYHNPFFDHSRKNIKNLDIFTKKELKEEIKRNKTISIESINKIPKTDYIVDINKSYNNATGVDLVSPTSPLYEIPENRTFFSLSSLLYSLLK